MQLSTHRGALMAPTRTCCAILHASKSARAESAFASCTADAPHPRRYPVVVHDSSTLARINCLPIRKQWIFEPPAPLRNAESGTMRHEVAIINEYKRLSSRRSRFRTRGTPISRKMASRRLAFAWLTQTVIDYAFERREEKWNGSSVLRFSDSTRNFGLVVTCLLQMWEYNIAKEVISKIKFSLKQGEGIGELEKW